MRASQACPEVNGAARSTRRDRPPRCRPCPRCRRRYPSDRGGATVVACVGVLVLMVITGTVALLAAGQLARERAENAADLGALAGAAAVLQGSESACSHAESVTAANSAAVAECAVDGVDVRLIVTVDVRVGPLSARATGRARAGPLAGAVP